MKETQYLSWLPALWQRLEPIYGSRTKVEHCVILSQSKQRSEFRTAEASRTCMQGTRKEYAAGQEQEKQGVKVCMEILWGSLAKDWVTHMEGDTPSDGAEWTLCCEAEN